MPISTAKKAPYDVDSRQGIGANSLTTVAGQFFLKRTGNIVDKATAATDRIVGVNETRLAFASDNQTVAKAKVWYVPKEVPETYICTISGGTITADDEGKFYNLSAADVVNGATESTVPYYTKTDDAGVAVDALISMQLEMVRFISATQGEFRIVNL
jgi:hypothetical protein